MLSNKTESRAVTGRISLAAAVVLLGVAVCISVSGVADSAPPTTTTASEQKPDVPKIDAQAMAMLVQHFDRVEKEEHPWGWIRWLMNSKLDPNAAMTFGLVKVNAGQRNPLHVHANCEEILYVLSGSCEHLLGKEKCVLKKGDAIRIPAGVPHCARTFDDEPLLSVIVYSSGDRQFEVVEEK